jgi:peptide/nickel transport system substrate-binding protein
MDNPDCRAAVGAAIDRRALQQTLGRSGDAVRSSQLWPRALSGGPKESDPAADPAGARASLKACGQPDGFSTVLAVADAPASVGLAKAIAGQLGEVGIKADVRPLDATTFYATDVGDPGNVAKNGYGLVLATWTADFPTPSSFLMPLVDGRSIRSVGNTNYARLNSPDINKLIDAARAATDPAAAQAAWRKVASAARASSAYLPLAETRVQLVAGQRLRNGLVMQPYSGYDLATAGVR